MVRDDLQGILKSRRPHVLLNLFQVNQPVAARASLTLKLTAAYSRATGQCRATLLGVRFRKKVRGERKEAKDGEPIATPAASTHVWSFIKRIAGSVQCCVLGAGAGASAPERSAGPIRTGTGERSL